MNIENKALISAVLEAASQCTHHVEEEGGVILERGDEYTFGRVKNIHAGTETAIGLYETDLGELKSNVFNKLKEGWKMYASFHTHPSFGPTPSNLDLTKLFTGFKNNVIFSPRLNVFSFNEWDDDEPVTYYLSESTLQTLLKK